MRRFVIIVISAATGVCFATLAGMSIAEFVHPVRARHPFSCVIAVFSVFVGYLAFRAAISGKSDELTLVTSLRRGIVGALVGLLAMVLVIFLFRDDTNPYIAHALGNPAYSFTDFRLLAGSVLLGFGTGFVIAMPRHRG